MGKPFLQRLHAKGYADSWRNPLFSDPKVRERSLERLRYFLYSLLVIASGAACLSLLFWFGVQDKFAVTSVRVEGMRSISDKKLAQDVLRDLSECTAWFSPCLYAWNVPQEDVLKGLQHTYALEQITGTLQNQEFFIQVREAVTLIPLRIGSSVWFASQTGVLQMEATQEDIAAGILIPPDVYSEIDVSEAFNEAPGVGMQVLSPEVFESITAYKKAFTGQGIAIASFTLTKDAGKIIANTAQGFSIFFTPWEDASVQVRRLGDVLQEATPQSYVDIRFGERIYVK